MKKFLIFAFFLLFSVLVMSQSMYDQSKEFAILNNNVWTETYLIKEVFNSVDVTHFLNDITQFDIDKARILTWSINYKDFSNVYLNLKIVK
jgi:hypothetical protein